MKRLSIVLAAILLVVAGCQTHSEAEKVPDEPTTTPAVEEAPDDLVTTPNGWAYRANVHQVGVTNPWPEIQTATVDLGNNISIIYRDYIETDAGETRNNIVNVIVLSGNHSISSVNLSTSGTTPDIEVNDSDLYGTWTGPGKVQKTLALNISRNVEAGEYTLHIGFLIDGNDYGQLPCTINVMK